MSEEDHKCFDVPCEMCSGTGTRRVCILKSQPCLPASVLLKAEEFFEHVSLELSAYDGIEYVNFVISADMKGTYEEMIKRQDDFHEWLRDNYPDEISSRIVITVNRIELTE